MMRRLQLHNLNFPSLLSSHLTKGWQPTDPGDTNSPGPMEVTEVTEVTEATEDTPAMGITLVSIPAMDLTLIMPDCRLLNLHRRKMFEIFQ